MYSTSLLLSFLDSKYSIIYKKDSVDILGKKRDILNC